LKLVAQEKKPKKKITLSFIRKGIIIRGARKKGPRLSAPKGKKCSLAETPQKQKQKPKKTHPKGNLVAKY